MALPNDKNRRNLVTGCFSTRFFCGFNHGTRGKHGNLSKRPEGAASHSPRHRLGDNMHPQKSPCKGKRTYYSPRHAPSFALTARRGGGWHFPQRAVRCAHSALGYGVLGFQPGCFCSIFKSNFLKISARKGAPKRVRS